MNSKRLLQIVFFILLLSSFKALFAQTAFSSDVVYSIPKHNTFYNSTKTTILLKFNGAITKDAAAIKSSITILDNGGSVPYTVIYPADPSSLILRPISPFSNNSKIEVTVDNNLTYQNSANIAGFYFFV